MQKPTLNLNNPMSAPTTFRYHAIDHKGMRISGTLNANNIALAKVALSKQGLRRINLTAVRQSPFAAHISHAELCLSFRTLATLLSAGIVLTDALAVAANNASPRLSMILNQIKNRIEAGGSFTDAISMHQRTFGSLSVALIHAGEISGMLDVMLDRLALHFEQIKITKAKLNKAMLYPVLVIITAIIVMMILLIKVVPIFADTFISLNQTLPLPTRIALELSAIVSQYWLWLISLPLLSMGAMIYLYLKKPSFQMKIAAWHLRLPIFGKLIQAVSIARFSRTLAICLDAGVPLTDALSLAGQASHHPIYNACASTIRTEVLTGKTLQQAIIHSRQFDMMSIQMISVGETSGNLGQMLNKLADYHEQMVASHTERLLSLLEPAIILILGLLVGGLVLAMYLPMIELGMG